MSMTQKRILGVGLAAVIIPVILGASCPAPQTPYVLTTGFVASPTPPACEPNFVCISIVNTTLVAADVALYTHDGYDLNLTYPDPPSLACCPNANPQNVCPCPRPGYNTGELQLTRAELFQLVNLQPISGSSNVVTLQPQASVLKKIQCENVKSMGIDIDYSGTLVPNTQYKFREGVYYRERLAPPASRRPGEVRCGGTIQFVIYDTRGNIDPIFADLAVRTSVSQ